jgi:hypothetical protein
MATALSRATRENGMSKVNQDHEHGQDQEPERGNSNTIQIGRHMITL